MTRTLLYIAYPMRLDLGAANAIQTYNTVRELQAILHGTKVVYEVHDLEASHPSKASRWPQAFWVRFLPWLDRTALRRSDRLVSLTETFKRWAAARGIRRKEEIAVVPDAFDPALYYPR